MKKNQQSRLKNLPRKRLKALLFSLLLLAACGKDFITGKATLNYFSLSSDIKLGEQVLGQQLKELENNHKKIDQEADPVEFQRVRKIVQKLVQVVHIPSFPYEAHLADVEVVNAWCAPGGKIMVYTGLWDKEKGLVEKGNEAELAAVLGHEMAHANARHVTKHLSVLSTIQLAGAVVASAIAQGGAAQGSDLFNEVFRQGMSIYVPSYSRSAEAEADRIGLFYMAKAGYNPEAAVRLWERATQKRGDETSIYASHPSNGTRAKALKALLPAAMEVYKETLKKK